MNVLTEVLEELWSMFVGDRRLTLLTLVVIAIAAAVSLLAKAPLVAAVLVLVGSVAVLTDAVFAAARKARGEGRSRFGIAAIWSGVSWVIALTINGSSNAPWSSFSCSCRSSGSQIQSEPRTTSTRCMSGCCSWFDPAERSSRKIRLTPTRR